MTAEQSIRDRVAEVLRAHLYRTAGSQDAYLGVCSCEIATHRGAPYSHDDYRTHVADALASAGLLAEESETPSALEQVALMWDEQIAKGLPFLADSDLVPTLRTILSGVTPYRDEWP